MCVRLHAEEAPKLRPPPRPPNDARRIYLNATTWPSSLTQDLDHLRETFQLVWRRACVVLLVLFPSGLVEHTFAAIYALPQYRLQI